MNLVSRSAGRWVSNRASSLPAPLTEISAVCGDDYAGQAIRGLKYADHNVSITVRVMLSTRWRAAGRCLNKRGGHIKRES
jgi:hypothetical protein